jgi:hypothetical protein
LIWIKYPCQPEMLRSRTLPIPRVADPRSPRLRRADRGSRTSRMSITAAAIAITRARRIGAQIVPIVTWKQAGSCAAMKGSLSPKPCTTLFISRVTGKMISGSRRESWRGLMDSLTVGHCLRVSALTQDRHRRPTRRNSPVMPLSSLLDTGQNVGDRVLRNPDCTQVGGPP